MNVARCSDILNFVQQIDFINQLSPDSWKEGVGGNIDFKITATMLQTLLTNNQIYWSTSRNPIVGRSLRELSLRVKKNLKDQQKLLDRIADRLPFITLDQPIVFSLLNQLSGAPNEMFQTFRNIFRVSKLWNKCARLAKIEWINNHKVKLYDDVEMINFSKAFQYALKCGIRLKHLGFSPFSYKESPGHIINTGDVKALVEKCPNLTSVELCEINNQDLSLFLSYYTNLTSLRLFANAKVYEINSLPSSLKKLQLECISTNEKYPTIWPELESLTIERNRLPSSFPPSLKRLEIRGCMMPENLPGGLLELEFEESQQESFYELTLPNSLTSLQFLKCDKLTYMPKKLPPNLQFLKIVANTRIRTIPPLPCSLKNFVFEIYDGMSLDYPLKTSVTFPELPLNLEKLKLVNWDATLPIFPESLKHLIVNKLSNIPYLRPLPEELVRLSLFNSHIGTFRELPPNLQAFELQKCKHSSDFRYPSIPTTLRRLAVSSDCKDVFLNVQLPKECSVYY